MAVVQAAVPVQVLRVDGGLTRSGTLLQLQADTAGVTVQRGLLDATAAGAAALAAVGSGVWGSTLEIEEEFRRASGSNPSAMLSGARPRTRNGAASSSVRRLSDPSQKPGQDVLGPFDVLADELNGRERLAPGATDARAACAGRSNA